MGCEEWGKRRVRIHLAQLLEPLLLPVHFLLVLLKLGCKDLLVDVVVATIQHELLLPAVEDVGAHRRQKVAVMRDDHQRVLPLLQVALQPDDRVEVEVGGRRGEQQQPRLAEERARERDAHPPAARAGRRRPRLLLLEELEPWQKRGIGCMHGRS